MDFKNGTNYNRGDASCDGDHWANAWCTTPNLVVKCYISRSGGIRWYQQAPGGGRSINDGLYVKGTDVTYDGASDLSGSSPSGMRECE